jgi:drug/metabolite transporter (DMT)-like permease
MNYTSIVSGHPLAFALLAALSTSCMRVILRSVMKRGADAVALGIVYSLGAGLLLLALFGFPKAPVLTAQVIGLLALASVAWSIAVYTDTLSYRDLDASTNALFGALRYVLLVGASIIYFEESLTLLGWLGVVIIMLSIALASNFSEPTFRRGACYRFVAILFINVGILIDKKLTTLTDLSLVLLSAYIMPVLVLMALMPHKLRAIPHLLTSEGWLIAVIIVLQAGIYGGYVYSFAATDLIQASTVLHTSMFGTFILELMIERNFENIMRRFLATVACSVGVLLIVATI